MWQIKDDDKGAFLITVTASLILGSFLWYTYGRSDGNQFGYRHACEQKCSKDKAVVDFNGPMDQWKCVCLKAEN